MPASTRKHTEGVSGLPLLLGLTVLLLGIWFLTSPAARSYRQSRMSTADLRAAAADRPRDAALQLALGGRLIGEGAATEAVPVLQRAVDAGGGADALAALGDALARAERDEEAFAHLRLANSERPRADVLRSLGALYLKHSRPDKALPELEHAVRLEPEAWEGWQLLALARRAESNWTEAAAALRRAVALQPNNTALRLALGEALLEAGQLDAAEPELRRAVRERPDSARVHLLMGRLHLERTPFTEHAPKAEAELRRALALDASLVSARYALAHLLLRTDRPADAERELAEVLHRDPTLLQARFRRADALRRLGRSAEAAREAAAFHRAYRLEHAEMQIRGRLTLRPGDPRLHERLAGILDTRGRRVEAERERAEARRLRVVGGSQDRAGKGR